MPKRKSEIQLQHLNKQQLKKKNIQSPQYSSVEESQSLMDQDSNILENTQKKFEEDQQEDQYKKNQKKNQQSFKDKIKKLSASKNQEQNTKNNQKKIKTDYFDSQSETESQSPVKSKKLDNQDNKKQSNLTLQKQKNSKQLKIDQKQILKKPEIISKIKQKQEQKNTSKVQNQERENQIEQKQNQNNNNNESDDNDSSVNDQISEQKQENNQDGNKLKTRGIKLDLNQYGYKKYKNNNNEQEIIQKIQQETLQDLEKYIKVFKLNPQIQDYKQFSLKYDFQNHIEWNLQYDKIKKNWNQIYNLIHPFINKKQYYLTLKCRQHDFQPSQVKVNEAKQYLVQQEFNKIIHKKYGSNMVLFLQNNNFQYDKLCYCQDTAKDTECWTLQIEQFLNQQFDHPNIIKYYNFYNNTQLLAPNKNQRKEGDVIKINEKGEQMYDIESIRGRRTHPTRGLQYFVQWKGYLNYKDNTWQCESDLTDYQFLIKEFQQYLKENQIKVMPKQELILPNLTQKQIDNIKDVNDEKILKNLFKSQLKIQHCCVLMETAIGDLYSLIEQHSKKQKPLKFSQLQPIIKQILLGIQEIHKKGYSHNDIKSDNILIFDKMNSKCKIKIGDFGHMKLNKSFKQNSQLKNVYMERNNRFIAPELILLQQLDDNTVDLIQNSKYEQQVKQINGKNIDEKKKSIYFQMLNQQIDEQKCDIFSLGLMIYEIVFLTMATNQSASFEDPLYKYFFQSLEEKQNQQKCLDQYWQNLNKINQNYAFLNDKKYKFIQLKQLLEKMLSPLPKNRPNINQILENQLFQ